MPLRLAPLTGPALACALLATGCTTIRTTSPPRSAQEELLISTAADRAATALARQMPTGLTVMLDASGFSGPDKDYAIAAVKDRFLRHGLRLADSQKDADAVVLLRDGALATRERESLVGSPAIPIPFLPGAVLPEVSLYKHKVWKGVAKFAATAYDPKTGKLITATDPAWGFSRQSDGTVLFLITWSKNDMGVDLGNDPPDVKPSAH